VHALPLMLRVDGIGDLDHSPVVRRSVETAVPHRSPVNESHPSHPLRFLKSAAELVDRTFQQSALFLEERRELDPGDAGGGSGEVAFHQRVHCLDRQLHELDVTPHQPNLA